MIVNGHEEEFYPVSSGNLPARTARCKFDVTSMATTSDAVLRPLVWNFTDPNLRLYGRYIDGTARDVAVNSSFMDFIATDQTGTINRQPIVMAVDEWRNMYLRIAKQTDPTLCTKERLPFTWNRSRLTCDLVRFLKS